MTDLMTDQEKLRLCDGEIERSSGMDEWYLPPYDGGLIAGRELLRPVQYPQRSNDDRWSDRPPAVTGYLSAMAGACFTFGPLDATFGSCTAQSTTSAPAPMRSFKN